MRSRLSTWLLSIAVAVSAATGGIAASTLPAQSSSQSGVTIKITPRNLAAGLWEFDVVFDTHSQELTDELEKTAVLVSDARASYSPVKWQVDAPGGHHRKGVLRARIHRIADQAQW